MENATEAEAASIAAADRKPYVATAPIISGEDVVNAGVVVSLTAARAAEFDALIRPATITDLAIFSRAPIPLD